MDEISEKEWEHARKMLTQLIEKKEVTAILNYMSVRGIKQLAKDFLSTP